MAFSEFFWRLSERKRVFRKGACKMKKGFTLAELLITIVILAVLTAIALPNFQNTSNKAKANVVVAALQSMRAAEQAFFSKNGFYWGCVASPCTAAELRSGLGVEIPSGDYQFAVYAWMSGGNFTFSARARQGAPPWDNSVGCSFNGTGMICVRSDGLWEEDSPYVDAAKLNS